MLFNSAHAVAVVIRAMSTVIVRVHMLFVVTWLLVRLPLIMLIMGTVPVIIFLQKLW